MTTNAKAALLEHAKRYYPKCVHGWDENQWKLVRMRRAINSSTGHSLDAGELTLAKEIPNPITGEVRIMLVYVSCLCINITVGTDDVEIVL